MVAFIDESDSVLLMNSITIGIAGYMGGGKTTCCRMLADSGGFQIIDGDRSAKELMINTEPIKEELVAAFGESVISDNNISFENLGSIVFGDMEKLRRLNEIVHPRLLERLRQTIFSKERSGVVVVDAALLPLWNIDEWFNIRIWIDASFEARLKRMTRKMTKLSKEDIIRRMRIQESVLKAPSPSSWKYIINEEEPERMKESVISYISELMS